MTTEEDDFHAALDANPDDWHCRLVFADFLEERGDPRAEGYRALGVQRKYPHPVAPGSKCPWYCSPEHGYTVPRQRTHYMLPNDWFDLVELDGKDNWYAPDHGNREDATRRELDDAAALAFSKLPPERRAELLNQVEVGCGSA